VGEGRGRAIEGCLRGGGGGDKKNKITNGITRGIKSIQGQQGSSTGTAKKECEIRICGFPFRFLTRYKNLSQLWPTGVVLYPQTYIINFKADRGKGYIQH
jgi:hypothetical protein